MNALVAWWSFIWGLYLQALALGSDLGGLPALLIYLTATAAAFGAAVLAPIVILIKLVVIALVLSVKATLFVIVFWVVGHAAQGATQSPAEVIPSAHPADIPRIVQAVGGYAKAIACETRSIAPGDVTVLSLGTPAEHRDDARFAVLWTGDIGCAGGSVTSSTHIAIVTVRDRGSAYLVDPLQSSPVIHFLSPVRVVDRIVETTKNTLVLEGMELDDRDANCCPSLPVRFTLRQDARGHWRLVNRTVLKRPDQRP